MAKNKENKKAARVNAPPKTFSFQSLSDFPCLLLNGYKDSNYFNFSALLPVSFSQRAMITSQ